MLELITKEMEQQFFFRIDKKEGCWIWKGGTIPNGYGLISLGRRKYRMYAHRFSYLLHYGELSDIDLVCHTCDIPACVNPLHLFKGTMKDNIQDCKRKGRLNSKAPGTGKHKLTVQLVKEIYNRLQQGRQSQSKIAKDFNVSIGMISRIKRGQDWKRAI